MKLKDFYQETEARIALIRGAFKALPPRYQHAVLTLLLGEVCEDRTRALQAADKAFEAVEEFEAAVLGDPELYRMDFGEAPDVELC